MTKLEKSMLAYGIIAMSGAIFYHNILSLFIGAILLGIFAALPSK